MCQEYHNQFVKCWHVDPELIGFFEPCADPHCHQTLWILLWNKGWCIDCILGRMERGDRSQDFPFVDPAKERDVWGVAAFVVFERDDWWWVG